jgi:hypothetical protein
MEYEDKVTLITKAYIFKDSYLTTLSVSMLLIVTDGKINEYRAVDGMRIGRGYRSILRKHSTLPLRSLRISHDLIWN